MSRRVAAGALLAGLCAGVARCGAPAVPSSTEAIFQVRACRGSLQAPDGETFRILLRDGGLIAQARALVGASRQKIVSGTLVRGDGGFNAPWSWHLDPSTMSFTDVAPEVCDGCPSFVEASGGQWGTGTFCPWSSEIVGEQK